MNTEPTERMTEAQLQKIESRLFPDSYEWYHVLIKPEVNRLTTSLRNAYAEVDALRSELGAMACQIAEVTENYEIMSRAWDISDGSYDRKLRRGECVCSGYRDIEDRKASDPACPIHGEVTE